MTTTTLAPATDASGADQQYQAALATVTSAEFRNGSARQKQDVLWRFISRLPYTPLPSMRTTDLQLMVRLSSRAFLRKSFVQDDDVRPPRTKAFHTYATVAAMRLVADGTHPFTGIFATGAVGFVRASLAVGMPNYSPAAALKFLLDGPHPSENMMLHQSLDKLAPQLGTSSNARPPTTPSLPIDCSSELSARCCRSARLWHVPDIEAV